MRANFVRKIAVLFFLLVVPSSFSFSDQSISVYFSPNGGCQEAVVSAISKAQKSIDIAMYSFTSREIAQALVEAKDRQVKVRIVLDKAQRKQRYSKSRYLISKGFEVKYHLASGLMHNKFAVIDGQELLTGSFNWTASADKRNEENFLILMDKDLIKKYEERFEYLWQSSGEEAIGQDQDDEGRGDL